MADDRPPAPSTQGGSPLAVIAHWRARAEAAERERDRLRAAVQKMATTLRDRARDIDSNVGYYDDRESANRAYGKAEAYRDAADDIADLVPPTGGGEGQGG